MSQHVATRRNRAAKRTQHVETNNVAICCVDMLRSFGRDFYSRGVNSTHHCYYTMASADSKFDDFGLLSVFTLNNKNVNALIARELSRFSCSRSLTMNSNFQYRTRRPRAVLRFLVHCY